MKGTRVLDELANAYGFADIVETFQIFGVPVATSLTTEFSTQICDFLPMLEPCDKPLNQVSFWYLALQQYG